MYMNIIYNEKDENKIYIIIVLKSQKYLYLHFSKRVNMCLQKIKDFTDIQHVVVLRENKNFMAQTFRMKECTIICFVLLFQPIV